MAGRTMRSQFGERPFIVPCGDQTSQVLRRLKGTIPKPVRLWWAETLSLRARTMGRAHGMKVASGRPPAAGGPTARAPALPVSLSHGPGHSRAGKVNYCFVMSKAQ
jgi:hypothetical protein